MNDIMDKIKKTKILGIVGNALIAVGTLLPVLTSKFSSETANLMDFSKVHSNGSNLGIWVLLLAIFNLVVIFSDKLTASVPALEKLTNQKYSLAGTVLAGILVFIAVNSIMSIPGASLIVGFGFGFWVLIIGFVAAIAYPFLYKGE